MQFYVINNTKWQVSEVFLKWLLNHISKDLAKTAKHRKALKKQVGIVFIDQKAMRKLNKQYRGKDKVTDVLSFAGGGEVMGDDVFLGDIVLCVEQVKKQAEEHDLHASEELCYLVVHGLLHLLGYDHEVSPAEAKKMFRIQDKLFADLQDRDILKAFNKKADKIGTNGKKT